MKTKIYVKLGDFDKAIQVLNEINSKFADDILGDDALFMLGNIYEEKLKDKEQAMNIYQSFLIKYPGSIFITEARKKFRLLRGDRL